MTINTPEPGELVKTVSELVTAVNAQPGALDSRISVYSGSPPPGGQVNGFAVDDMAGDDLTLNADTSVIDVSTAGLYYIQWNIDQGASCEVIGGSKDPQDGGEGSSGNTNFGRTMIRIKTVPARIVFTANGTPGYAGADIYRLA